MGVFGDQINNGKRVEESGYGYRIDITNYNEELLASTLQNAFSNEEMRDKMKRASDRIQKDDEINSIANQFMYELNKLL